jgi:tRNA-splicing ligase RtcB (3'-phosphate/5'-hydroxy nucleic acid ligase)
VRLDTLAAMKLHLSENDGIVTVQRDGCPFCTRVLLPKGGTVERKALEQLAALANIPGARETLATPDIHPGNPVPVGSILVTDADVVVPAAIGKDINCGMRLVQFDLAPDEWHAHEATLLESLRRVLVDAQRDVAVPAQAFAALAEDGAEAFAGAIRTYASDPDQYGFWHRAQSRWLEEAASKSPYQGHFRGASRWLPQWMVDGKRPIRESGFATLGSGNHFFEFQTVDGVANGPVAWHAGLRKRKVCAMVHTGSRDIGSHVGGQWMAFAREAWPASVAHPEGGLFALRGAQAADYLSAMSAAAHYAWANRSALTELARQAISRALHREVPMSTIVDVPHNVIMQEGNVCVHRKGATPAHENALALIPGSMGDYSYLMQGLGNPLWASSCSHGAGRVLARGEAKHAEANVTTLPYKIIAANGARIREELPAAYKAIGPVIEAQTSHGLVTEVARLAPIATFKM